MSNDNDDPTARPPSYYDSEPYLKNKNFIPHILTVAANGYAWHASKLYIDTLNIGLNETRVLSILYEYNELQAWQICDILSINKATVSQSLKTLENRGLVNIERRREGRFITPTDSSKIVHRQIVRMARSREEILLDGFSEKEREQFNDFLERFYRNLPRAIAYANANFVDHNDSDV